MTVYARWLFGIAAASNISVALLLLLWRDALGAVLDLAPIEGTNVWFVTFSGAMIGLFGVTYVLIARDPKTYRPCIAIFAAGKALAWICSLAAWAGGHIGAQLPLIMSADAVFALLFVDYLRRTRAP
jgi:hypothetical protein